MAERLVPGSEVSVPYVVNGSPVTGHAGSRSFAGSIAWFRTNLQIDQAGMYALRFESVNHRASIWIDGRLVGQHVGSYLPFEIRTALGAGQHTLVLRADWRSPWAQSRQGWHRTWFNFGGINRGVSIRPIGASELLAPTLTTRLDLGRPDHGGRRPLGAGPQQPARQGLTVTGWLQRGDQRIDFELPAHVVGQGHTKVFRTQVRVPSPALWQPGSPSLYDLHLGIGDESAYGAHVGLRQITWSRGRLFINGHLLKLRGASIQEEARGKGDALSAADQDALVADLKRIGANATRCSTRSTSVCSTGWTPPASWSGRASGPSTRPATGARSRWPCATWRASACARRSGRPSCTRRSSCGASRTRSPATATQAARRTSSTRWPAGCTATIGPARQRRRVGRARATDGDGLLYRHLDAIGVTNYLGWYEDTLAPATQLAPAIRARVAGWSRTFAGKVLVVSEFGAEANAQNPTHRPGGFAFQARLLNLHIRQYRLLPRLSGMLVWNLRDFAVAPSFSGGSIHRLVPGIHIVKGLNQKGVISYYGRPKPSATIVRRQFAALARASGGCS